jgi:hypothetical protein
VASSFSIFRTLGCSPITIRTSPAETSVSTCGWKIILPSDLPIASVTQRPQFLITHRDDGDQGHIEGIEDRKFFDYPEARGSGRCGDP